MKLMQINKMILIKIQKFPNKTINKLFSYKKFNRIKIKINLI